ncbi:protein tweety 1-like [Crotalus adamanteus]|uniref:Protein tweety homolog n=1 Tax=Crotalus adamanteus TaxID=8729 RepID=A0AAW1B108_CROAD
MGVEDVRGGEGLSDFCFEPDRYVMNTTQARTGLTPEILQYYLTCSQDIFNPFQQRLTVCQRALSNIHSQLYGLERETITHFPAAEDYVDGLKGLCYDGMEGLLFLLLFSFLSALSFTTVVCSLPRAWKRFQNRDSDYDDMEDDDPFTPQARRPPTVCAGGAGPSLPSSFGHCSSWGSRVSLRLSAPPISNAPVSQYM